MHIEITANKPYSKSHVDRRVMDLFLPERTNNCGLLFIHGGGWCAGEKKDWDPVAKHFAEKGFVCANMEYRLSGQAPHPAQIEDARLGMSYFRAHAASLDFDPDRIAVVGSSAGGHLGALLATIGPESCLGATPELKRPDTRPNAAILYCPAVTLCRHRDADIAPECVLRLMNNLAERDAPDAYREASPLERITGKEPPFLFLHGDMDNIVPLFHSEDMVERLKAAGVHAELRVFPGLKHGFGYGTETEVQKQALEYTEIFLNEQFHIGKSMPT